MPYIVSVAGFTSKGRGAVAETDIFFIKEGGMASVCNAFNLFLVIIL